jgi:hypothetical protein
VHIFLKLIASIHFEKFMVIVLFTTYHSVINAIILESVLPVA